MENETALRCRIDDADGYLTCFYLKMQVRIKTLRTNDIV